MAYHYWKPTNENAMKQIGYFHKIFIGIPNEFLTFHWFHGYENVNSLQFHDIFIVNEINFLSYENAVKFTTVHQSMKMLWKDTNEIPMKVYA